MESILETMIIIKIKQCRLDELPLDILDDIFINVSGKDLISCLAVCTRFNHVIVSSNKLMDKVNSEN